MTNVNILFPHAEPTGYPTLSTVVVSAVHVMPSGEVASLFVPEIETARIIDISGA